MDDKKAEDLPSNQQEKEKPFVRERKPNKHRSARPKSAQNWKGGNEKTYNPCKENIETCFQQHCNDPDAKKPVSAPRRHYKEKKSQKACSEFQDWRHRTIEKDSDSPKNDSYGHDAKKTFSAPRRHYKERKSQKTRSEIQDWRQCTPEKDGDTPKDASDGRTIQNEEASRVARISYAKTQQRQKSGGKSSKGLDFAGKQNHHGQTKGSIQDDGSGTSVDPPKDASYVHDAKKPFNAARRQYQKEKSQEARSDVQDWKQCAHEKGGDTPDDADYTNTTQNEDTSGEARNSFAEIQRRQKSDGKHSRNIDFARKQRYHGPAKGGIQQDDNDTPVDPPEYVYYGRKIRNEDASGEPETASTESTRRQKLNRRSSEHLDFDEKQKHCKPGRASTQKDNNGLQVDHSHNPSIKKLKFQSGKEQQCLFGRQSSVSLAENGEFSEDRISSDCYDISQHKNTETSVLCEESVKEGHEILTFERFPGMSDIDRETNSNTSQTRFNKPMFKPNKAHKGSQKHVTLKASAQGHRDHFGSDSTTVGSKQLEVNGCRPKQIERHNNLDIRNHDEDGQKQRHKIIGFPFLRGLLGKDPGLIITELTQFAEPLHECVLRAAQDKELLELVLQVISEAYMSQTTPRLLIRLFESLKKANFFQYLTVYIVNNGMATPTQENKKQTRTVVQALKHALIIITKQITRNPSAVHVFQGLHAVITQAVDRFQNSGDVDKDTVDLLDHFTEEVTTARHERKLTVEEKKQEKKPPDDFKQYPVSPRAEEVIGTTKPFLRPNRIEGGYEDLHDYLDVQFRLLREDFVGPLREGMNEYIGMMEDYKENRAKKPNLRKLDIKVYENVKVQAPVITQYGLGFKLKLEMTPRLKRMKWKFSKRLIFGSLVCLTDNDFEDFIVATVIEREDNDIRNGFFVVRFEEEGLTAHDLLHKVFQMAETTGYFESYRHVLASLQGFNEGDLPFEKYIVKCEKEVGPPKYLRRDTTYDLRPLVDTDVKLQAEKRLCLENVSSAVRTQSNIDFSASSFRARAVRVSDLHNWPPKELIHMDESQYKAVQTALTKEFAIIQGPPGTGKTYIGLQIVKALLHNKSTWAGFGNANRPMLIVCYTNHALDQFLEGVIKFFDGDVLRVGGRSNSEELMKYNIKTYRKKARAAKSELGKRQRARKAAWWALKCLTRETIKFSKKIEIYKTEILHEDVLEPVMGHLLYHSLFNNYCGRIPAKGFSFICSWLGIHQLYETCLQQSMTEEIRPQRQRIEVEDDAKRRMREVFIDGDDLELEKEERMVVDNIRTGEVAFYVAEFSERIDEEDEGVIREAMFYRLLKAALVDRVSDSDIMSQEDADGIRNVWRLNEQSRWRLYRLWIKKLCSQIYDQIEQKRDKFEEASERYREALKQEDNEIMRQAAVIGMTTSCAARYQSVLREISPRIVIVEEAAEVLEAHIVTTLSKGCEHLILIGDHKQLRPIPSVYKLAVKYKLDISLFERMVKNEIRFDCLELQHRMRPEISSIMRHIYPELQDHEQVKTYPNVKGVSKNFFLIDHKYLEDSDEDIKSYSNTKEAEYAVALCKYMLLQGYQKTEITVLTTYTGQLMCLRNLMPKHEFDGVKVTVVDNYQGEENEIIILSLVRSNLMDKIGFLKIENRICVALSRAKVGFYVLGNFEHLATHSVLWENISNEMKEKGGYGEGLKLYCQNHPNDGAIIAKSPEDFREAPEGGCMKMCDVRLKCGHKCERYCHILDPEHETNKCQKKCRKILCERGHRCPDLCFKKCRPCREKVKKIIPKCGHEQTVPCATDPEKFICQVPCKKILSCNHVCQNVCGMEHTLECTKLIKYTWQCGHSTTIQCHDAGIRKCSHPCESTLSCEHVCSGTCSSCFEGRIHRQCTHKCKRILVCGHECNDTCNNCPPCTFQCQNRCKHSKCTKSCGEPCEPCGEKCAWECQHYQCQKLCSEPCDRPKCNKPCWKMLKKCKHQCIGLCGEPCPKLCRICQEDEVTTIFFGYEDDPNARFVLLEDCGHIVESRAMDKYMETNTDENSVQLKGCPFCKTPIRKCLRYGDIINQCLQDIEMVKRTMVGSPEIKRHRLEEEINRIDVFSSISDILLQRQLVRDHNKEYVKTLYPEFYFKHMCKNQLLKILSELQKKDFYTEAHVDTIDNQFRLSLTLTDILVRLKTATKHVGVSAGDGNIVDFFETLLTTLLQPSAFLFEQEVEDYKAEIRRGTACCQHLKLKQAIRGSGKMVEASVELETVSRLLFSGKRYDSKTQAETKLCMSQLKDLCVVEGLGITDEERLEIVKAVGLSKGHWFKCPNNHVYVIGECGGAMEKSVCPECKAEIGGNQHRLTDGNRLAPEMDGASFAAFSEEANNMANFDLDNLH